MINSLIDLFYIALFSAFMQNQSTLVTCDFEWVTVAFYNAFWTSTEVLFGCYMAVKTAAISAHVLCTPYNHDQDLLHATVVKQG